MLRNYRCAVLAIVGCLTLSANHPNPARPDAETSERIGNAVSAIAATLERQEKEKAGSPDSRPCEGIESDHQSDLCAQWTAAEAATKAANWAVYAAYLSAGSLLLSIIGLFALLRTLGQTDRSLAIAQKERASATRRALASERDTLAALSIAERNAETATGQLVVAQDTAKRRLRAYVSVTNFRLVNKPSGAGSYVEIIYSNGGQTPAYECRAFGESLIGTGYNRHNKLPDAVAPEETQKIVILPGTGGSMRVDFNSFPGPVEAKIASGEATAFINGFISYRDVFKEDHKTKFCLVMDAATMEALRGFSYSVYGNESD